jgi:hypothetical protein
MKNKSIASIIFFLVLLFIVSTAVSAKTIAVIRKVKGDVSLYRDNKVSQQKLKRGTRLLAGDKIVTDKKAYAAIIFIDDKSLIRVRSNSTCTIRTRTEKNQTIKNVFLEVGTIYARITKQNAKFEVQTPTSVASVKGTEWLTEQILNGGTFYYCKLGSFEVSNDVASALCRAGEMVEVKSSNSAPVTSKIPDDFEGWDIETGTEDFEFEFENDQGEKRLLRFRVLVEE